MSILEADHARIVAEAQARWVEIARQDRMAAHQRGAQEAERQHAKALAEMERAHAAALADANLRWDAEVTRALDEGEKIGRLYGSTPRTLAESDPEPAVGSVVLGRYEISGQRVMDDDEETTIWRFSDGGWCYEWATVQRMYGPVILIHDGGAA